MVSNVHHTYYEADFMKKRKKGEMGDWEAPQAQHFVLHIQHEENGVVDTIHTSSRHHTILKNQKHIL